MLCIDEHTDSGHPLLHEPTMNSGGVLSRLCPRSQRGNRRYGRPARLSLRSDRLPRPLDHDDDVVAAAEETVRRRGFEGDSVADAVSGGCSSCGGDGDGVGIEPGDHVVSVGEREGDGQPTVATADDRDSLPGWRHRVLLGLEGDVQRVEGVAGDFVHFQVDEPGFREHLEGELFTPRGAKPGPAFGQ
jgi:hypothetical protein